RATNRPTSRPCGTARGEVLHDVLDPAPGDESDAMSASLQQACGHRGPYPGLASDGPLGARRQGQRARVGEGRERDLEGVDEPTVVTHLGLVADIDHGRA